MSQSSPDGHAHPTPTPPLHGNYKARLLKRCTCACAQKNRKPATERSWDRDEQEPGLRQTGALLKNSSCTGGNVGTSADFNPTDHDGKGQAGVVGLHIITSHTPPPYGEVAS